MEFDIPRAIHVNREDAELLKLERHGEYEWSDLQTLRDAADTALQAAMHEEPGVQLLARYHEGKFAFHANMTQPDIFTEKTIQLHNMTNALDILVDFKGKN